MALPYRESIEWGLLARDEWQEYLKPSESLLEKDEASNRELNNSSSLSELLAWSNEVLEGCITWMEHVDSNTHTFPELQS